MRAPPCCSPRLPSETWCVAFARCSSDPKAVLLVNAVDVDPSARPTPSEITLYNVGEIGYGAAAVGSRARCWTRSPSPAMWWDPCGARRRVDDQVSLPCVADVPLGCDGGARRQSRVRRRTTAGVAMRRDEARWCRAPRDRSLVGDRMRHAAYRRVDGPSLRPVRPWLRLSDSLSVSIIRTGQPYDPAPLARADRSGGRAITRRRGGVVSHHVRRIGVSSGARPGQRGESA